MELQPGKYRYAELAEICGISRTTAEKFKERYTLIETFIPYNGRDVKGVILSEENCQVIKKDFNGVTQPHLPVLEKTITTNEEGNDTLTQYKIRVAQLEMELKGKLDLLEEKDKRIVALEKALKANETANDALNNERIVITQQLQKYRSQDSEPEQNKKKSGWWPFGK